MANRSCNICLEEKEIVISKYRCIAEIVCHTCQSGYVCKNCIPNVDPRGSIFLRTKRQVANAIKCPCCRVLNWNYHYNQIVLTTLGYGPDAGEGDWQYENINREQRVFLRNAGIVWDFGDEVIEWATVF